MKPNLPFLEVMMLRSCNLSCRGCTTFSDLKHQGDYSDWETNRQWLIDWSRRLNIEAIGLMGGEPLIHPRIRDWLLGMRETLPRAQIRFVTNGLLLDFTHQFFNHVFQGHQSGRRAKFIHHQGHVVTLRLKFP